jgi:Transposase C of IS166 homeodomain
MVEPTPATSRDLATVLARVAALEAHVAAREERNRLLEEENRWLKAQLFGRSSEKTPRDQINPDQVWLFNEAEALAKAAEVALQSFTIPAHERSKRGRKKLAAELPHIEVVHDIAESEKICAVDGTPLERIGQETSEQLDFKPAQLRVICNTRWVPRDSKRGWLPPRRSSIESLRRLSLSSCVTTPNGGQ